MQVKIYRVDRCYFQLVYRPSYNVTRCGSAMKMKFFMKIGMNNDNSKIMIKSNKVKKLIL